jgi:hypothetical protein
MEASTEPKQGAESFAAAWLGACRVALGIGRIGFVGSERVDRRNQMMGVQAALPGTMGRERL